VCLLSAVLAYMYQAAWLYVAVIAFGGLVTIARDWSKPVKEAPGKEGIESLGASKVIYVQGLGFYSVGFRV